MNKLIFDHVESEFVQPTNGLTDSELADWLRESRGYLLHRAQLSSLYHRKRERFFNLLEKSSKVASLVAGTAVFSTILPTANQKALAGFFVSLVALLSLIFAWGDKVRLHSDLAQKFFLVEAGIFAVGIDEFEEQHFNDWLSKLVLLDASEPPIYETLRVICSNQVIRQKNTPMVVQNIGRTRRFFAHFID